jgi:hypothetical protein
MKKKDTCKIIMKLDGINYAIGLNIDQTDLSLRDFAHRVEKVFDTGSRWMLQTWMKHKLEHSVEKSTTKGY